MTFSPFFRFALALFFLLLTGCAAQRAFNEGKSRVEEGDFEAGFAKLEEAIRLDPETREYRMYAVRERERVIQRLLTSAEEAKTRGKTENEEAAYQRVLALAPGNVRALKGMEFLAQDKRINEEIILAEDALKSGKTDVALDKVRKALATDPRNRRALLLLRQLENANSASASTEPRLKASFRKAMTLEFRDASLRQIFELISRNTGLNFIFDRDVRSDLRATLMVRDTSVEEIVRFLLVTNQLDQKILNDTTVLVYPATQAKQRDYQDLMTKTFFIANADVKQTANLIKTLLKARDVFVDEKLGLVTMRDTPQVIRTVERLLATHDLAEPEVMLEVEVLEISTSKILELGIQYPSQVSASILGAGGTVGSLTLKEALERSANLVQISVPNPALAINLKDQLSKANILANPKIRVKNKNQAKIHIGDKVPVITTTTNSTGFAAESVNYLDVGLKLEVEPDIHVDNEVGMKINLEVSNIAREVRTATGTLTYQIGTRNTSTTLRVKDGETQILAGLISDEDRSSANQIPGLGELPMLRRLFGSQNDTTSKTEIVLLITPRVVRGLTQPDGRMTEFMSGTEANVGVAPLQLLSAVAETEPKPGSNAESAPSASSRPSAAAPENAAASRVVLSAPAQIVSGQDFKLLIGGEFTKPIKGFATELTFDPARFSIVSVVEGAGLKGISNSGFRSSSPEGMGRLAISLNSEQELPGPAEIAVVTMRATVERPTASTIRVQRSTLTAGDGKVLPTEPSAPISFSILK